MTQPSQAQRSSTEGADPYAQDSRNAGPEPENNRHLAPSDGGLAPEASAADPVAALWGADRVSRYREQWQQLQLHFVDSPQTATDEAAALVDDAVGALTSSLEEQKHSLDSWRSDQGDDTEVLRMALRRYRDFLDRLLGM